MKTTMLGSSMVATLAAAVLSLASFSAFAVDCSIPSQRDATCVGTITNNGATITSNSALGSGRRGANALPITGVDIPAAKQPNECVSVEMTRWALDPQSFGTNSVSFVTSTAAGILGAAGANSPNDNCSSNSDGSCTTWVPAAYPYLFTGNGNFVACGGPNVQGSVSCPVSGSSAYVTTNPNDTYNFSASMIACKTGSLDPGTVVKGAPLSWWSNCSQASQCSFNLVFPSTSTGDN